MAEPLRCARLRRTALPARHSRELVAGEDQFTDEVHEPVEQGHINANRAFVSLGGRLIVPGAIVERDHLTGT